MPYVGTLIGDKVVVFDLGQSKQLYALGYFGKPVGESKPREFKSPLELSLVEAVYLTRRQDLRVLYQGEFLDPEELASIAQERVSKFSILSLVYEDLREKGFVVRSGIKFGADFSVYTVGPGIEHAPYLVIGLDIGQEIPASELMGFGRLSHSVKKRLILALVDEKARRLKYITFKWERV